MRSNENLSSCVEDKVSSYLDIIEGNHVNSNLYKELIHEIEKPMLVTIMGYTRNNQSKAAKLLGINRVTLRSKLKKHGMLC